MVNPNNPNSEPDEVPPSEPSSGASGGQSSESGPISDELFDSLSELLGDSPASDEPASLPDLEPWSEESEQPAEPLSASTEDLGEILEDPTLIQMGTKAETTPMDELSAISDGLSDRSTSTGDSADILPVSENEGHEPIPDPWVDEPVESMPSESELPVNLTSDLVEIPESSLPNIEAAAAAEPSDIISDPWADPAPEEPTPVDPVNADIEEPTLIQASDFPTSSEDAAESTPPESPSEESPLSDLWTDAEPPTPLEATAVEPSLETDIPTPETAELSEFELTTEPIPELAAEVPPVSEVLSAEVPAEDSPIPEDESLLVGEASPTSVDEPLSIGDDSPPSIDVPLPVETSATEESEESSIAPDPEFLSPEIGEAPSTGEGTEALTPLAREEAEPAAEIPPLEGVDSDSSSMPLSSDAIDPVEESSELASDSEPDVASSPVPELELVPEPVAIGLTSTASSSSATSSGDLGAVGDKLPLNRYQVVGLLVALSTLGTIAYLGVTGNQQDPSLPDPPSNSNPSSNDQSSSDQQPEIAISASEEALH